MTYHEESSAFHGKIMTPGTLPGKEIGPVTQHAARPFLFETDLPEGVTVGENDAHVSHAGWQRCQYATGQGVLFVPVDACHPLVVPSFILCLSSGVSVHSPKAGRSEVPARSRSVPYSSALWAKDFTRPVFGDSCRNRGKTPLSVQ